MKRALVGAMMVLSAIGGLNVVAQTPTQRVASPAGSSATEVGGQYDLQRGYVGGKWIEIKFGRPIKRGRDLFGPPDFADALANGAPVWRAGANISTRLDVIDTGGRLALLWDKQLASVSFTIAK